MRKTYWQNVQEEALTFMKRECPRNGGWMIDSGKAGVNWFCKNRKPDLIALRRDNRDRLDVILVEVKAYDKTPLRKTDVDQLISCTKNMPNAVYQYRLWLIVSSDTEIPPEVRDYAYDSCPCFEIKRLRGV